MIKDIKEFEKLLKLCRKHGVREAKLGDVEVKLGDLPQEYSGASVQDDVPSDNPYANFPTGVLTPEQLMFYSAGGVPEDDPVLKAQAS